MTELETIETDITGFPAALLAYAERLEKSALKHSGTKDFIAKATVAMSDIKAAFARVEAALIALEGGPAPAIQ